MLTPAVKPVTAGKKIPKITAIDLPSGGAVRCMPSEGGASGESAIEISDRPIKTRITYCARIAKLVEISVTIVSAAIVMVPQIRIASMSVPQCT